MGCDAGEDRARIVGGIGWRAGGRRAFDDDELAGFHSGGGVLRVAENGDVVALLPLGAGLHGGGGGAGEVYVAAVEYCVAGLHGDGVGVAHGGLETVSCGERVVAGSDEACLEGSDFVAADVWCAGEAGDEFDCHGWILSFGWWLCGALPEVAGESGCCELLPGAADAGGWVGVGGGHHDCSDGP